MSTDGMATKTTMHINRKTRGGQAVAKTETITVSKRFANNLRELAYLLDDKRPLAEFLDEHCGWVLVNLVEEKASTTRARGMSQCLTPDMSTGTRSGCIAANTELSSRKHERRSCGAN